MYDWKGKSIEPNENDGFYTRTLKSLKRRIMILYAFDSLAEFEENALRGKIKEKKMVTIPDLSVEDLRETKYGLDLVLNEGENILSFRDISKSDAIYEFRCIKEKTWLDLHKLNIGDEVNVRFFYYTYNAYQLVFIEKKDDDRGGERGPSSIPKNRQSIDDFIMEVFKEK